jgi:hypothetical protein
MTMGRIFAAACAQEEGSVAEQAAVPGAFCMMLNGSFFTGGSWAAAKFAHVRQATITHSNFKICFAGIFFTSMNT